MKTFSLGGVHPHDSKLSRAVEITQAPMPTVVEILLAQHIGAPAKAVVKKGDTVKVGDLIGESGGFVSANIHSSVSGTVTAVDTSMDSSGVRKPSVTIRVEGDEWREEIDQSETLIEKCELSPKEIVQKVAQSGIVGLGGATFPSHVKLGIPAGKTAEALVVNGVECEPYLTADHRLMLERSGEIIVGCQIVMKAIGVGKCYIGVENNKPDAIATLQKAATEGIEIVPLKVQYPQGGEKQLIDAAMGRRVPSGALPIEVGAVVQNVGTIYAIYQAVQKNRPIIDRVVTVTGKKVASPKNMLTRIGTPLNLLIEECGGEPEGTAKIINGGPMMGRAVSTPTAPVTKGTSGVLLMDKKESKRKAESVCISCAKCVSVCPMGLEPYLMYKLTKAGVMDRLEAEKITDCIECGCCSFTCPATLPLLDYIRIGKGKTMQLIRSRQTK
ncbi:MAG: electron transport complex subunit RsxC [Rikenellaceae bacterium]